MRPDGITDGPGALSESWFSKIPPGPGGREFGGELFIRAMDPTGAPVPEDDRFAGLR